MSSVRQPTVLFDVVTELARLLGDVAWQPLVGEGGDTLNTGPVVHLGEMTSAPERETIAVTGTVTDDQQDVWPERGLSGKAESFSTVLVVVTNVPNRTWAEAWARLKEIVTTIDGTLRDLTSGRPSIPDVLAALGVTSWAVASVDTLCWPTDEGFHGAADITVAVRAHI